MHAFVRIVFGNGQLTVHDILQLLYSSSLHPREMGRPDGRSFASDALVIVFKGTDVNTRKVSLENRSRNWNTRLEKMLSHCAQRSLCCARQGSLASTHLSFSKATKAKDP